MVTAFRGLTFLCNLGIAHRVWDIRITEGFLPIDPCSISRKARLNLGSGANYSEMHTYILAYCTAAQSFPCLHSSA